MAANPRSERALDTLSTLGGSEEAARGLADFFETRGALGGLAFLTGAGEVWARDDFSRRDRSVVVISALVAMGREVELRQHLDGGLNHGLSVDEIDEILVQLAPYVGLPCCLAASLLFDAVVAERDGTETRTRPRAAAATPSDADRRAAGLDVLGTLLGNLGLEGPAIEASILESQGDMGQLVMDYAFGDVWSRPGLSRRDRSLVVVSALAALNMTHELQIHIGGGLEHGLTPTEVEEIMITMVIYGGFPKAIDGQRIAREVFAARGLDAG